MTRQLHKVTIRYWGGSYHSKGGDLTYYVIAPTVVMASQNALLAFGRENDEFERRVTSVDEVCPESSIIQ